VIVEINGQSVICQRAISGGLFTLNGNDFILS